MFSKPVFATVSFLLTLLAHAGEPQQPTLSHEKAPDDGYFTFYFDNDAFVGSDRNYSNGLRFAWLSAGRSGDEIGPISKFLSPDEGGIFGVISNFETNQMRYHYGVALTQLIYTPDNKDLFTQPIDQRRYAGWLGLGFSLQVNDDHLLNSLEFMIGTTGRDSLAEATQDSIHDLRGVGKFNGWDNQIPNEITGDVAFVQKRRRDFLNRDGFRIDGLAEWGVRLGTFKTDAHLGGQIRAGYNLTPDFSDAKLSESAYTQRTEDFRGNWSAYAILGADGRGIAHDATIDGPLFRDFRTGIEREPFVGEIYFGVGLRYRRVELSYVHTWRSEEYKEQAEDGEFGSFVLRAEF